MINDKQVFKMKRVKKEKVMKKIKKKKEKDNEIVGKIGATIKMRRKLMQRTLNYMSEISGVSISYMSKVENDLMRPNLNYLTNVIEHLEINEKVLSQSLQMRDWYDKLIKHVLEISNYKEQLDELTLGRNDFQSKIITFSLMVHESKFSKVPNLVMILVESALIMHTYEFSIFILTLANYYIKIENHFAAGEIIKELDLNNLDDSLLKLWYLEIKYELALYQSSYLYYSNSVKELVYYYYNFNLNKKLKELRERSCSALAYFLEPEKFFELLEDENIQRSFRLSHIHFKRFEEFKKLEKKNDLAQLLFEEINGNFEKVEKQWLKVEYMDDPFEQTLKEYFKYKYDFKNLSSFLEETLFADTGLSQHHYGSNFIAEKLNDMFSNSHKYKQCYLLNKRINKLNEMRSLYLELKDI